MAEFILALTTVPEEKIGRQIARVLVEERLAACVTISAAARSVYRWEGKICAEQEFVLLIKTRAALYGKLEARIKKIHPYQVPEIVTLSIGKGSTDYLAWLGEETET
jgi:periplasmic divalent cation tolerance protein